MSPPKLDPREDLMHLEEGRYALYRETQDFLNGHDTAPPPPV